MTTRHTLAGDLPLDTCQALVEVLTGLPFDVELDMADCDISDGRSMAALTAGLKQVLAAQRRVHLTAPPQLVVHNLYRIGYYPHPLLTVTDLRQDEAYG